MHIFTDNVLTGLDTFSETERISAEYKYLSSSTLRTYNMLSANFSCAITVFSLPSMIKYPPISFLHSPILCRMSLDRPCNTQKSDCTIMGNLPRKIRSNVCIRLWVLPSVVFSDASRNCVAAFVVIASRIWSLSFFFLEAVFFGPPPVIVSSSTLLPAVCVSIKSFVTASDILPPFISL